MIEILNDLKDYCKDCPNMVLTHCETLGSGRLAYTCKHKRICEHCVEKFTDIQKDKQIKKINDMLKDKQAEKKSCDNCAMQYSCVGLVYGNYWCWRPKESEE